MNCTKCGQPLTIEKQADILDAEVTLSALAKRPVTLPDWQYQCDECFDVTVGEEEVH